MFKFRYTEVQNLNFNYVVFGISVMKFNYPDFRITCEAPVFESTIISYHDLHRNFSRYFEATLMYATICFCNSCGIDKTLQTIGKTGKSTHCQNQNNFHVLELIPILCTLFSSSFAQSREHREQCFSFTHPRSAQSLSHAFVSVPRLTSYYMQHI